MIGDGPRAKAPLFLYFPKRVDGAVGKRSRSEHSFLPSPRVFFLQPIFQSGLLCSVVYPTYSPLAKPTGGPTTFGDFLVFFFIGDAQVNQRRLVAGGATDQIRFGE